MKNKPSFKKWYSIPETAFRLSSLSNEKITPLDVTEFIIDYKINTYVYLQTLPTVKIYPVSKIHKRLDFEIFNLKNLSEEQKLEYSKQRVIIEGYEPQSEKIQYLHGKYKIVGEEGFSFLHSNFALLFNRNHFGDALDEKLFIEHENETFEVLERLGENEKYSDKVIDYYHRMTFFELNDFFLHIDDLVKFENPDSQHKEHSQKEENNDLKILGALLKTSLKRGEKRKNSLFSSQSEIITELLELYPNVSGLSKRTLEARFAAAKRLLEEE